MKKISTREYISLLIIPIMYLSMYITFDLTGNTLIVRIVDTIIRITLMFFLCYLFKDILKKHFYSFKSRKRIKWFYVILGALFLQIIISIISKLAPSVPTETAAILEGLDFDLLTSSWSLYFIMLFTSLSSSATAIIEDIVFKHTLLNKLLTKSVVINTLIVLFNSFVFGAIHYANFGNSIINTIPYMFAGLFLNIVYLKTRNLFYVLFIHLFNNFVISTLITLMLGIVKIFYN
ncbi:CPBP family intramembrane metalloprotease [Staphylococcus agnetis]|uniref:CPBP family intramembrane glutamic endopeptidase n=1 Tax=Staphylococcus agnetis TaxID=985762 RepID=UPI00208E87B6|nr:CPBP family intramembrane glutamic endopeptidase [Staphylococcus agnetis]MCO4346792.1 CPBP family intramembrane metalloprotease [Staphylococcus agnetis]